MEAEGVEDGGHRPMPLGRHGHALVLQDGALAWPLERDDVVAARTEQVQDREELLDVAVEAPEDDEGATGPGRAEAEHGEGRLAEGDLVRRVALFEQRVEVGEQPGAGRRLARVDRQHEELGGA